nr:hypothetical protein N8D75_16045 [Curtobacterium flaccumfaciens]
MNIWLARLGFGSVPRLVVLDEPEPITTAGYPDADKTEPADALG